MKVVLDTNCFISCIGKKSNYRGVFDAYLNSTFSICVSTEILLEYEEKFTEFWGEEVTHNLLGVILTATNTFYHSAYYNFYLVDGDADDNKFSDIFVSSSSDYLVSNDKDILELKKHGFPIINVLTLEEFHSLLLTK